jgi:polysaccharide pyruvyl transferase WcaK-like protein
MTSTLTPSPAVAATPIPAETLPHPAPRVLLIGYNGATNTGAEALLQADIADLRAVLGDDAFLTVPTLNEQTLRRYLSETGNLRIVPIPAVFPLAIRRLVSEHDVILLVEGSAYMDTWASALLWLFLWSTHCAGDDRKPCLAYAVDAGELRSPLNRLLTRKEASKTGLIIARSAAAAERLRGWGVRAPMEITADNAFTYAPDPADAGLLRREWPEARERVAGFCPVNVHLWPVVIRPWGRKEDRYRWPYYFSDSRERREEAADLAAGYAALADRLVEHHGMSVALLAMEGVDDRFCRQVHAAMKYRDDTRVFSASGYNASQMTCILRDLDLLVTSRYHGAVLSLAAGMPQVAVGHDLRLKSFYAELGMVEEFFDADSPDLWPALTARVEEMLANPGPVRELLRHGYETHVAAARRNRELLRAFLVEHGWEAAS